MNLPVFEEIEKLIDEHGSAEILKAGLRLAKDQCNALEVKQTELEEKVRQLESEKRGLELEHGQLVEKIQFLESQIVESQPAHIEEIQERILQLLADHPRIASDQVAKQLHVELELSNLHLEELKAAQLVVAHTVLMSHPKWGLSQDGRRYLASNGLLS